MAAAAPPFEVTGKGFIAQYYPLFGSNRSQVGGVYRDNTLMTYQGKQMQGVANIMAFFNENITFSVAQFQPDDVDCHPSPSGGVIVVVNGTVLLDQETRPIRFNDVFHLATDAAGQWYVSNQMFRTTGTVSA